MFSHWLIWHGRRRCDARNPDCPGCEIRALCPRLGVPKQSAARYIAQPCIALVSAPLRPGRFRLQHGPGRGAAAGRAAPGPAGAALLRLDRAGGLLRLLPEVCRDRAADTVAPAGAPAHRRRPRAARCGLDLQPRVPAVATTGMASAPRTATGGCTNGFEPRSPRLNLATELAPACRKTLPGQCFQGHERFDLLWRGRKIAGAAQRRTRDGLLIQGSVQPPGSMARTDWEKAMCDVARAGQGADWTAFEPDAPLAERAIQFARQKYSQAGYSHKR